MHHSVAPRSRKLFACRAIRPGNSERKLALLSAPAGGRRILIVSFCKPVLASSPYRSPESKDAQSASGSRGDLTSWMVQPKPSGDGQNDRKRGASQSDVARQTQSLPNLTLRNPGNHCYLNSLVQALCWIYFDVPSDRNSVFGDLRPLLRPLLSAKGRVQLLRRSAWRSLLRRSLATSVRDQRCEMGPFYARRHRGAS